MELLDRLQDLDFSDRKTQLMAGGAVALATVIAVKGRFGKTASGEDASAAPSITIDGSGSGTRSDAPTTDAPGVLGWVGTTPGPTTGNPNPAPVTTPAAGVFVTRKGKAVKVTPVDPAPGNITCPAGYVAIKRSDGRQVCSIIDDTKADPTRYNSFNPLKGAGPGLRKNQPAGQAGAGPMSGLDTNDYDHPYSGRVGGFTPVPSAITAATTLNVRAGETPRQLAARAFGHENYLDKVLRLNPQIEQNGGFTEGDAIRVN